MGPVNWLAVILAANLAVAVGLVWYGPLFGGTPLLGKREKGGLGIVRGWGGAVLLQLVSAAMIGHNFARIGAETLGAKPWLYPMMSGGLALAFVVPAIWISYSRQGLPPREALVDGGFWIAVYLAMSAVFWALG